MWEPFNSRRALQTRVVDYIKTELKVFPAYREVLLIHIKIKEDKNT